MHHAIRMTPFQMSTSNNKPIRNLIHNNNINHKNYFPNIQVGTL